VCDSKWSRIGYSGRNRLAETNQDELLRLATSVDTVSEHQLAEAIFEGAKATNFSLSKPEVFDAIPCHGVTATIEGDKVALGNLTTMHKQEI